MTCWTCCQTVCMPSVGGSSALALTRSLAVQGCRPTRRSSRWWCSCTSLIRGACPGAQFSSFTLQRNVQVQMHVDKNSERGHDSIIIPCGRWQGGSLWIQNDDGAHALDTESGPGTMQRITWPCIKFSPQLRHATMPWSSGDRTILVAYVVRSLHRLG